MVLVRAAPEPHEVGAAFDRLDVVGVREDGLLVAVVVLHGDLDADPVTLAFEVDRGGVQGVAALVEEGDELDDSALEQVGVDAPAALVPGVDLQALVEEGQLAQAVGDQLHVEVHGLEDLPVGPELNHRTVGRRSRR